MKKIISVLLCLTVFVLSGCGTATENNNKKLIAVSFYPIYIFTLNLIDGVDGLAVQSVGEQNIGCLHDYAITAKDAKLLNNAEVLVINGAGMEGFVDDLQLTAENLKIVDSSIGAKMICSENHQHHHHDNGAEITAKSHVDFNSHIWMSVENAKIQVLNIKNALSEIFPEYEEKINENYLSYIKRLNSLKNEFEIARDNMQGKKVYSFHDSYAYLAEDLGFTIHHTIQTDEGNEPSAKMLAELSEKGKNENITALLTYEHYNGSAAEIISNETGIETYILNPVTTGEKTKTAYEDIMRENLKVLKAVK